MSTRFFMTDIPSEAIERVRQSGLFDFRWFGRWGGSNDDDKAIRAYLAGDTDAPGPNVLFDDRAYLEHNPDVAAAKIHPLLHYIDYGRAEGRRAGPLFDEPWYVASVADAGATGDGPLAHYLRSGRESGLAPNSVFDPAWYLEQYPDVAAMDPLEHYVLFGAAEFRDPNPFFSTRYYRSRHPHLIDTDINPLGHFLLGGQLDVRARHVPIGQDENPRLPPGWAHLERFDVLKSRLGSRVNFRSGRPILVFGTHEMSRTGAPLIILNLIKAFAETGHYEIVTFADRLGELEKDFRRYSHIVDFSRHHINDANLNVTDLILELGDNVRLGIFNTANMNHYIGRLKGVGVPVISLVHEMLYVYPVAYVADLYRFSDLIIFPADFVRRVADAREPIPAGKAVVRGQGLLDPAFGNGDRAAARAKIRREFGLAADAPVVLGCGTVNIRKGVDLFISLAREIVASGNDDIRFIWLGSETVDPTFAYWMKKDVEAGGLADRFHFVGERADPAPYYLGSDVFAMTSREDPFPCVIHEAMACGLATVAFADAGGAPEALRDGSGVIVPYGDTKAMGDTIIRLFENRPALDRIGEAAKARVRTHYRFSDYARDVARLAIDRAGASISPLAVSEVDPARPRVLFFARDWWISGVNSFAETLARHLLANGVDVKLVFPTMNQANAKFLPDLPTVMLDLEGPPVEQWQRLSDYIVSEGPCIVIPNYDYNTSALTPALPSNIGSIGIVHSDDVEHYDHVQRLGRYWNAIICSNNHLREEVIEINPALANKTRIIPYGVSISPDAFAPRTRVPGGPIRLVYCGRLTQEQKRVGDLIGIVSVLNKRRIPFHLTVIGEGDHAGALKTAWHREIADGQIAMPGRLTREETYEVYARSDIMLLVSAFEGMPIALIEAMACGCVPVVTDLKSGIPDLVTDATGFRLPIGDAEAFADTIARLRDAPGDLARHSAAAIAHIRTGGFTTEAMGDAYLSVIRSIWQDLTEGTYVRPKSLNWHSPIEGISPPPSMFRF